MTSRFWLVDGSVLVGLYSCMSSVRYSGENALEGHAYDFIVNSGFHWKPMQVIFDDASSIEAGGRHGPVVISLASKVEGSSRGAT